MAKIYKTAPESKPEEVFDYAGEGPWFTCDPTAEVAPRVAKTGVAGPSMSTGTLIGFLKKVGTGPKGKHDALLVERPVPELVNGRSPPALPREQWTKWTWTEYHNDVRAIAKAFIALGYKQFDTCGIWGFNAPEWHISCLASMYAGGKSGGIYPTDTSDTAGYKVVHSGASIVCVDDRDKIAKIVESLNDRKDATKLKAFIAWGFKPDKDEKVQIPGCGDVPVYSWEDAKKLGSSVSDEDMDKVFDAVKPGHCCALIYTSGTTGEPKAVMISHDNCIFESASIVDLLKPIGFAASSTEERVVSYLPLSHIAGMAVDILTPINMGAVTDAWSACFFARKYDLKLGTIKDRLVIAKPTLFMGVPLVWEKMADKIRAIGAANGACLQKISGWAKGVALEKAQNLQLGGSGAGGSCCADKILAKVKAGVGLDECKIAVTGAAPIRVDTLEYFGSLGIYINECYGMSECAALSTLSTDLCHQWGSCGFSLPGVMLKIYKVDPEDVNKKTECPRAPALDTTDEQYQGEICWRGRNNMMGYLANKDLGEEHVAEINKKTAECIDKEGWLHSGDKGMMTTKGMVKITGRYKELIIGEGGENIAPVPIEDSIKKLCDGVMEVMMIGDKRKYNVAMITLKAIGANGEVPGTDDLDAGAKVVNPKVTKISQAMKDKVWIDTITKAIADTNSNTKIVPNNSFKIQKFTILPHNFSEAGSELTPTKKLKRKVAETKYMAMVDKMYETEGLYIPWE